MNWRTDFICITDVEGERERELNAYHKNLKHFASINPFIKHTSKCFPSWFSFFHFLVIISIVIFVSWNQVIILGTFRFVRLHAMTRKQQYKNVNIKMPLINELIYKYIFPCSKWKTEIIYSCGQRKEQAMDIGQACGAIPTIQPCVCVRAYNKCNQFRSWYASIEWTQKQTNKWAKIAWKDEFNIK